MTLLILAAGLGSRYGGLKQIDPVTDNGEFIIDFSVYDAIVSGFDKIVFVINEENLELFRETIGKRFENKVKVEYAFQKLGDLPTGFEVPEGREKPWGTAQALLAARDIINEPFAVINADDFYGRSAYASLFNHLSSIDQNSAVSQYCMVGYVLENTLTENGTVSRGVCEVRDGYLTDVIERTKISKSGDSAVFTENGVDTALPLDTIVSMNCWGFTPDIFSKVMDGFARFLSNDDGNPKREYYLPFAVKEIMEQKECTVKVYSSSDSWYGVTYREDHDHVAASLGALIKNGTYPKRLNEQVKGISEKDMSEALDAYFETAPSYCEPYGNGHINDTFLVIADKRYIMQRMNTTVFPCPEKLMENILGVTEHIRNKARLAGNDIERSTLVVVPTRSGNSFFCDSIGKYWRTYEFTERTVTKEKVECVQDFYSCAEAFGNFQQLLSDYPAHKLHETIANFHNTPWRYENLMKAVEKDACGRLAEVRAEVEFARRRERFCHTLEDAHRAGELPLRVTHNDTKLNNILFDEKSGRAVCVIDLDTVMPGYSVNDFGDSIRFGANTAAEDETDLSKVTLDLELFEAYAKGFIKGCGGSLTDTELDLLPTGAMMMTLECGMRFLTDHLEGDVYFRIHRPGHNLDRARNQFALVADMEAKLEDMKKIIEKLK